MSDSTKRCLSCGNPEAPGYVRVLTTTGSADCCSLCVIGLLGRVDSGVADVTILIGAAAVVTR